MSHAVNRINKTVFMFSFLLVILPLWVVTVNKSVQQIAGSLKEGNKTKLKADVFFFILMLLVTAALIFLSSEGR